MTAKLIALLCRLFAYQEHGWKEIGETFYRWDVFKSRFGNVYLHYLDCKQLSPAHCHDHPWSFWAVILWGGYWEFTSKGRAWRGPLSVLFRPAEYKHNVQTRTANWSIILTGPKRRAWGFTSCEE